MILRALNAAETSRLLPLVTPDPASPLTSAAYQARLATGEYRPEWTWIADDGGGGTPAAAAVWWGNPQSSQPGALDGVFVHESVGPVAARISLAADLLAAAHGAYATGGLAGPPAYHVYLPVGWRAEPAVTAALTWRQEAAGRAGLGSCLERLRYEWRREYGLPARGGRLVFRAEPSDEVFAELLSRVLTGTLDATSRQKAGEVGDLAQARMDVAFYRDQMLGDRAWWRVAAAPDGEPVGFGIPSRNLACPVVGYLGVLPEHRGHGYAGEILAETTQILVTETDAAVIRADTDLANRPMAAAFERAGYRNAACHLVFSAH